MGKVYLLHPPDDPFAIHNPEGPSAVAFYGLGDQQISRSEAEDTEPASDRPRASGRFILARRPRPTRNKKSHVSDFSHQCKELFEAVRNDVDKIDNESLLDKYKNRISQCLFNTAKGGKHPTILHWIAHELDNLEEDEQGLGAGLGMAFIALKGNPSLLSSRGNIPVENALHAALASEKLEDLSLVMCNESDPEALRKAIEARNDRQETCLHVAIVKERDIATKLIDAAGSGTFLMQRRANIDGKELPNGGNTPLHDAVASDRCACRVPRCIESTMCDECWHLDKNLRHRQSRAIEIVRKLIERNDEALIIKNAKDQSPYLHHLATTCASISSANQGTGGAVTQDEATFRSDTKLPPGHRPHPDNADTKIDPPASKPTKGICAPEGLPSDCIADNIRKCLEESSFALGSFEKACECFFGNSPGKARPSSVWPANPCFVDCSAECKLDRDGSSPTFRPGRSISEMVDAGNCYEFVKFSKVMSQVDLKVSSLDQQDGPLSSGQMNVEKQWESLQAIFAMLRRRGVRKILKLRVQDNPYRPCSDEVIESCLDGFDVRYLDWNRPDLCADVILAKAPKVVELWLYSSGSNAVLRGWAGSTGLCRLRRVCSHKLVWGHQRADHTFICFPASDNDIAPCCEESKQFYQISPDCHPRVHG